MDSITVGIIGFGTVGTGVVKILCENENTIYARLGSHIRIKSIADLDIERERIVLVDKEKLTSDALKVIDDPEIHIIIELIGGCEPAKAFIMRAIKNRKHVVTANKALLAQCGSEIFREAEKYGVQVGFEASVGGGIPIIRTIKEGLVANNIEVIHGILNGTSNYILTKMAEEGMVFEDALEDARSKGYAEADPTLDIEGIDAAHKLSILLTLAHGIQVNCNDIFIEGISLIQPIDIKFAEDMGYKIKPLAITKKNHDTIEARVHPTLLPITHMLSTVSGTYNAIFIKGDVSGETMYYGKGAGMMATASAVVSDIVSIARDVKVGVTGRVPIASFQRESEGEIFIQVIGEIVSKYYVRLNAADKPGVLSKISGILATYEISIASVIQKGRELQGYVPILIMTHEVKDTSIRSAIEEIDKLDVIAGKTLLLRIEDHT